MADEVAPKLAIRRLPTRPGRVRVRRVRAEVAVRRRRRFAPAATFFRYRMEASRATATARVVYGQLEDSRTTTAVGKARCDSSPQTRGSQRFQRGAFFLFAVVVGVVGVPRGGGGGEDVVDARRRFASEPLVVGVVRKPSREPFRAPPTGLAMTVRRAKRRGCDRERHRGARLEPRARREGFPRVRAPAARRVVFLFRETVATGAARRGAADDASEREARSSGASAVPWDPVPDFLHAPREPQLVPAGCGARDGDAHGAQARRALGEGGRRRGVEPQRSVIEGFRATGRFRKGARRRVVSLVPLSRFAVRGSLRARRPAPRAARRETREGRQAGRALRTRRRRVGARSRICGPGARFVFGPVSSLRIQS